MVFATVVHQNPVHNLLKTNYFSRQHSKYDYLFEKSSLADGQGYQCHAWKEKGPSDKCKCMENRKLYATIV